MFCPDISARVNHSTSRLGSDAINDCHTVSSTSSPLKRNDACLRSPLAKKRSVFESGSFSRNFNVFDHGLLPAPQFNIRNNLNQESELSAASFSLENASIFTPVSRRCSSLRKSTLQQRCGKKSSWGRRLAAQALTAEQLTGNTPDISRSDPTKNRPRLSLDQFMPPMERDNPFSSQVLPNPSTHMVSQQTYQLHPISWTPTTSSSRSNIVDKSPTHIPAHFREQPRPKLDFSKSLPAGSLWSYPSRKEEGSFSTPQKLKSVRPLQAAFMSTGLVSKVNKNPEEPQLLRNGSKGNMPDTPCKRHVNAFATYPAPVPGISIAKAGYIRYSFGTPSTPFNPQGGQTGMTRRGSFLGIDTNGESQSSAEFELPPTPTKPALVSSYVQQQGNGGYSHNLGFVVGSGLAKGPPRISSKLNLSTSPSDRGEECVRGTSFGRSRVLQGSSPHSPTPLISISYYFLFESIKKNQAFLIFVTWLQPIR
jgi:mitosis inhibitor protein kinase SWE1